MTSSCICSDIWQLKSKHLSSAAISKIWKLECRHTSISIWSTDTLLYHYNEIIMGAKASEITSLTIVYSIVYSDADQRKHQSSASLAFVRGIHQWPVNSPHKWPVTRKMFPFDDVIILIFSYQVYQDCSSLTNVNSVFQHSMFAGISVNTFMHYAAILAKFQLWVIYLMYLTGI